LIEGHREDMDNREQIQALEQLIEEVKSVNFNDSSSDNFRKRYNEIVEQICIQRNRHDEFKLLSIWAFYPGNIKNTTSDKERILFFENARTKMIARLEALVKEIEAEV
jgi:hypothetical protein